jgi:hypothetical protein
MLTQEISSVVLNNKEKTNDVSQNIILIKFQLNSGRFVRRAFL